MRYVTVTYHYVTLVYSRQTTVQSLKPRILNESLAGLSWHNDVQFGSNTDGRAIGGRGKESSELESKENEAGGETKI
ncbi:hypothetical protein AAMO2058_001425800 [Amorphochlora amoebiformis]